MIQDDARETTLRKLFKLLKLEGENERIGSDSHCEWGIAYELKSTTTENISASRGVNLDHFVKWRNSVWICGRGDEGENGSFKFNEIYVLFPHELEEWFTKQEKKLKKDYGLMKQVEEYISAHLTTHFDDKDYERIKFLMDRGCRPAGALSFAWSYVKEHGTKITKNHAKTLRNLVREKGQYLLGKKLYYTPQSTKYGGTRIKWNVIDR